MSSESLKIARPGDLIWPGTRISPIKWHVGGQPWFPAECGVPDTSLLICGVCGERLKHILHVSLAPEEGTKDPSMNALMYLYVCTKVNCGKDPNSWRALRCQWRSPTAPAAKTTSAKLSSAGHTTNNARAKTLTTAGWGLGDTNQQLTTGGFDSSDLEAALDAMNETKTIKQEASSVTTVAEKDKDVLENLELLQQIEDEAIPLPGFYLDVSDSQFIENRLEKLKGSGSGSGSGGGGGRDQCDINDSLEHVHQLLQKYGENTGEGEIERLINYEEDDDVEETEEGNSGRRSRGAGKHQEENADPITWDGEGYEEDVVLAVEGRKGVDQRFLKFMKKLQRVPDQCVRQGRGDAMMPLWPSSKKIPDPGLCYSCGAPRVFEYQLMAPTIAALEESADWLKEEGFEDGAVERPPPTWDWVTVAVFGCRERCSDNIKGVYREEKVVICEEE